MYIVETFKEILELVKTRKIFVKSSGDDKIDKGR